MTQTQPSPVESSHEDTFGESISAEDFKAVFRNHPAGVAIITANDGNGPVGLTATSVISVSADPALLVFSLSDLSSAAPTISNATNVVVHMLGVDELPLARRFATSGIDRFEDPSSWSALETGEPVLTSASTWLRGRIVSRMAAGTSTIVAVRALQASLADDRPSPLVYHDRAWHTLDDNSVIP
ncbi:flavin reductase family protein [Arthrobacter sp. KN11-1C]|uniref:flavin reductase family protein n=1 Tax=Arthrobacter sp. KN11-1C TaxID=3445774 RepID=UPI003FA18DF1